MKRILSAFLSIVLLLGMMTNLVSAYDEDVYNSIEGENVMSFKITDADGNETTTFAPGDTILITAYMDSIWGDPKIKDDIVGFDDDVLPGAYGMGLITSCLVFDENVFDPKAGMDIKSLDSTINNAGIDPTTGEMYEMIVTKTSLADARKNGFYSFITESDTFNGRENMYAFFTGSGVLCQWKLVVKDDATSGAFNLPVGAYHITDYETGASDGLAPRYKFFDKWFAYIGHSDSQLNDRPVYFESPSGKYVNNNPYDGAYLTITIDDGYTPVVPAPDPMYFELSAGDAEYDAGDTVEVTLAVKNNVGINEDIISSDFEFDNTALKLVSVSTDIEGIKEPELNYDIINTPRKYEQRNIPVGFSCTFRGSADVTDDVTLLTLTFEVLPTAAGNKTVVSGNSKLYYAYPDAVIKLSANHTHNFKSTVIPSDCTTGGYTNITCECGLAYITKEVAAKGHTASRDPADIVTVPATCTEGGYTTAKCADCDGIAKVVYIAAKGHDYRDIAHGVSCTEDGYVVSTCKNCGDEKEPVFTEAWGHNYKTTVVAPTCDENGYISYKCNGCGDVYTETTESALGHDYVYHSAKAPTCTSSGWGEYITCRNCNYTTLEVISSLGHDIVNHSGKSPTCTEPGYLSYNTCSRCSYTTYREIPEMGHSIEYYPAQSPTCTDHGWFAYEACGNCDYSTYVELASYGHDLIHHEGQYPTTKDAGWKPYDTCSRCDYSTYEELLPLNYIPGDANADGKVNITDVSLMLKYVAGWDGIVIYPDMCDLNRNGRVDISDVSTTLKIIAGWKV